MKICVTVKAGAKHVRIEKTGESEYRISVKAPPLEGRANEAVVETLAEYLDLPKSRLRMVQGLSSKKKVIEII